MVEDCRPSLILTGCPEEGIGGGSSVGEAERRLLGAQDHGGDVHCCPVVDVVAFLEDAANLKGGASAIPAW